MRLQKPVADVQIGRCWANDPRSSLELSDGINLLIMKMPKVLHFLKQNLVARFSLEEIFGILLSGSKQITKLFLSIESKLGLSQRGFPIRFVF